MLKQNFLISITICSVIMLTACVSEQTYVGSERPVADRTFDNIEAARTRISLGLNYLRRGDNSQAKYNLERARSFAPNSAEVYSALAYYYQSVDEIKQADEHYRLAIQKDNNYADAYNNYGAFLCQQQRYKEAEQVLLKAVNRPGYIRVAESYENLAQCHLEQGHFEKARGYLDNSISHNPNRISSAVMMAGLSYAMGRIPDAKKQLDRIQRLGRVSARTVLLSYLIARNSGDRDTQSNAEQLLLTLYSDTPEALLLLQNRLEQSEFEQLRERYKDSLMANIVLPEETETSKVQPPAPVANPKLKIVRRKSSEPDTAQSTETASQQQIIAAVVPEEKASVQAETEAKVAEPDALSANEAKQQVAEPKLAVAEPAEPDATETAVTDKTLSEQNISEPAETDPDASEATNEQAISESAVSEATDESAISEPEVPEPAETESTSSEPAVSEPAVSEPAVIDPLMAEPVSSEPADSEQKITKPVDAENTDPTPAEAQPELVDEAMTQPTAEKREVPFHVVQAAESLYSISVKHNIRLPSLMQWNQLTPESVIKTGQKIYLAPVDEELLHEQPEPVAEQVPATGAFHVVAAGETMFGISYRYNVRLEKFLSWNNLTEQSKLQVGQKVYIVDPASVEP